MMESLLPIGVALATILIFVTGIIIGYNMRGDDD